MKIDVLIPCRNAPESLWMTLTHFWAYGDNPEWVASVTLLDNCSTDPRNDAIYHRVQERRGHQVIRHERDVGVWTSLNRGLALSKSRFVFVLTSDVLLGPETLPTLLKVQDITKQSYIGPDVATGISEMPILANPLPRLVLSPRYNGACWLMDWKRLQQEIGWYDPQFYVCFGDVDYVERLQNLRIEKGDQTLTPAVVEGLYICHLDKQSRRADMSAEQDTDMEIKDGQRFREKWRDRPDVISRHREISRQGYINFKEADLGGWKAAALG